jgi:hypothetical protein
MANAAPLGNPMRAATAVAETLTARESPTMRANSAVPSAAQRSANGAIQIVVGDIRDHCSMIFAVSPLAARYLHRNRRLEKIGLFRCRFLMHKKT